MGMFSRIKIGDVYGSLTVIGFTHGVRASGARKRLNTCLCECGEEVSIESGNLRSGNTCQCQKCAIETRANGRRRHGHSWTSKDKVGKKCYYTWQAMKRRCCNEGDARYLDYGGRGITICKEWRDDYLNFLSDMGLPPSISHQIDRKDNDGSYNPENCQWVTRKENARNKRNNRLIEIDGETKTLVEWSEISGVNYGTLKARIYRGVAPHLAIKKQKGGKYIYSTPSGDFPSLSAAAKSFKMSISGVNGRFESAKHTDWEKHVRT